MDQYDISQEEIDEAIRGDATNPYKLLLGNIMPAEHWDYFISNLSHEFQEWFEANEIMHGDFFHDALSVKFSPYNVWPDGTIETFYVSCFGNMEWTEIRDAKHLDVILNRFTRNNIFKLTEAEFLALIGRADVK